MDYAVSNILDNKKMHDCRAFGLPKKVNLDKLIAS